MLIVYYIDSVTLMGMPVCRYPLASRWAVRMPIPCLSSLQTANAFLHQSPSPKPMFTCATVTDHHHSAVNCSNVCTPARAL